MVNKSVQKVEQKTIHGPIQISEELLSEMQSTIDLCIPATTKAVQTINDSLVIANGLNSLRAFFQNEEVKKLVETMQDSTLGFLTDRDPISLAKYNKKASPQYYKKAYSYDQIVEALIPPMLEGYRFTGNEINIINGKGMPVKSGKHRKINELVGKFTHSVGGPVKEGIVAKMRCQAKWYVGGTEYSIGYGDDICVIHVEFDQYSGIDKLIGLAESKLFSRVLTRISGKLVIEGDVPVPENKEINPEDSPSSKKPKNIMDQDVSQRRQSTESKKVSYVEKLGTIIDDEDYNKVIQELLKEGKIKTPDEKQNVLRTKDEKEAKELFELIEDRKDLHDSAAKDVENES
jgi:hypothetical protein